MQLMHSLFWSLETNLGLQIMKFAFFMTQTQINKFLNKVYKDSYYKDRIHCKNL